MFNAFSLPFSLPSFGFGSRKPVNIASVPIHETETLSDKRSKRLQSLLKLNHANYSIIYNNLRFHNHTPHILGSSYIFGATPEQLTKVYEAESAHHEPWKESPSEIVKDDWRDFLGKREYQRAYIDFFEDQLVSFGYDWKKLLEHYLYTGKEPLINSMVSGLGHPLIHLGYAYELGSRHAAVEALALGTCFYDNLHKYIDDPSYTRPSYYKTTSVLTIIENVRNDSRLDGKLKLIGSENMDILLSEHEDVVLDHWNAWDVNEANLQSCFEEAQKAAVALVVATPDHPPQDKTLKKKTYDFFLLHGLTTSHATRILLPIIPGTSHLSLVRSWFLFVILAYMGQTRPRVDLDVINQYPLEGDIKEKPWDFVQDRALNGAHATDAHFVKGLRAMMVAEETWGQHDSYWRKAAVKMASDFETWGGIEVQTIAYQPH